MVVWLSNRRREAALAIVILLASVVARPAFAQDDGVAFTEQGAFDAIRRYHSDWEELDFPAVVRFHTPDFQYIFFSEVVEASAFPQILSESWMRGVAEYRIDESEFQALLIAPDHAYVSVSFADHSVYEDGSIAQTTGMMTYLLQFNGAWRVQRLHHSGPLPDGTFDGVAPD